MTSSYTILLAPNPSLLTGPGTNTIVLGGGSSGATVIDPATDDPAHLQAIIQEGEARGGVHRILVTHGHPDHKGGAEALKELVGAPIYAFRRREVPFADFEVADGETFPVEDGLLQALHTPGHCFDHLCYLLQKQHILFAGDLISGITTNVIIPHEGDMEDYLNSLKRLQTLDIAEIVPGHGPNIAEPQAKIAQYITHRLLREQQVLLAVQTSSHGLSIPAIVEQIYIDIDPRLHPVAAWSVEAHLLKLEREGKVTRGVAERWLSA